MLRGQGDRLRAGDLTDGKGSTKDGTLVDRHATLQVRQGEGVLTIAAVGGSDQVEEHLIFGDGQQLPLAQRPTGRREIAGEHADFADVWTTHGVLPCYPTKPMGRLRGGRV